MNKQSLVYFLILTVVASGITFYLINWQIPTLENFSLPIPVINTKTKSANISQEFRLKIGETAVINSENLKVIFLKVLEDSRCPADVQCVWAGQVTITLEVAKNNVNLGPINLTLGPNASDSIKTFDTHSIKLISITAAPAAKNPLKPSDYVAVLSVSKSESDEAADWQTYTNTKWGYTFKYPETWNIEESTELATDIRAWKRQPNEYIDPLRDIYITVYPDKKEWPNFERAYMRTIKTGEVVTVGGLKAEVYRQVAEKGISYKIISIQREDRLYTIAISETNPNMEIFTQILSTFKFID